MNDERNDGRNEPEGPDDGQDNEQNKLPPLYNPRRMARRNGKPVVRLRVLAFPMPIAAGAKWADDHQLGSGKDPIAKGDVAWRVISHRLPPAVRRAALVHEPDIGTAVPAFVVASNRTPEDLERASDLEMITRVQKILATDKPPAWYLTEKP